MTKTDFALTGKGFSPEQKQELISMMMDDNIDDETFRAYVRKMLRKGEKSEPE